MMFTFLTNILKISLFISMAAIHSHSHIFQYGAISYQIVVIWEKAGINYPNIGADSVIIFLYQYIGTSFIRPLSSSAILALETRSHLSRSITYLPNSLIKALSEKGLRLGLVKE